MVHQSGDSIRTSLEQYVSRWLIILLLHASFPLLLHSQVFPLKAKNHFLTKNEIPFLLNARFAEPPGNTEEINKRLKRLNFRGINTITLVIKNKDISFNEKGAPQRVLQRKIRDIKRIIRQADLNNMAVMIYPYELHHTLPEGAKGQYPGFLFDKLYSFRNVLWVLNKIDLGKPIISKMNPKQLRGVEWDEQEDVTGADFLIISDVESLNVIRTKPVIMSIAGGEGLTDSIMRLNRGKAYASVLKGASGILVRLENTADNESSLIDPFARHTQLLKSVFDTCRRFGFKEAPVIIPSMHDHLDMPAIAAVSPDSSAAALYLPSTRIFPFDIHFFGNHVKITWINILNGEIHHSEADGKPDIQLFIPPVSENNYTDWLLFVRRDAAHSPRTGF